MNTERTIRRFFSTATLIAAVYAAQSINPIVVILIATILESILIGIVIGVFEAIKEAKWSKPQFQFVNFVRNLRVIAEPLNLAKKR